MLQQLTSQLVSLFNDWWSWAAGLLALAAGLSWLPGGGAVVGLIVAAAKAAASFLEILAPIISGVFQGIIWAWQKVIWPGILDIIDSWATILTVVIIGASLWFGLMSRYEIRHIQDQRRITQLEQNTRNRPAREEDREPEITLPWPFNWR